MLFKSLGVFFYHTKRPTCPCYFIVSFVYADGWMVGNTGFHNSTPLQLQFTYVYRQHAYNGMPF